MVNSNEMTPYRLTQLVKLENKIIETMVNNVFQLSFDEMLMVAQMICSWAELAKEKKNREERECLLKQQ